MNEASDAGVRRVLDAMDRTHRRVAVTGWVVVAATLGAYLWLNHVAHLSNGVTPQLVLAAVLALTALVAWATFALAVLVLGTGRRILRAIELSNAGPV